MPVRSTTKDCRDASSIAAIVGVDFSYWNVIPPVIASVVGYTAGDPVGTVRFAPLVLPPAVRAMVPPTPWNETCEIVLAQRELDRRLAADLNAGRVGCRTQSTDDPGREFEDAHAERGRR